MKYTFYSEIHVFSNISLQVFFFLLLFYFLFFGAGGEKKLFFKQKLLDWTIFFITSRNLKAR